jgi:hypothetical protein
MIGIGVRASLVHTEEELFVQLQTSVQEDDFIDSFIFLGGISGMTGSYIQESTKVMDMDVINHSHMYSIKFN